MTIDPEKKTTKAARRRWSIGRFGRDRHGATAVEFGLIALPFFALLFAIIETGIVYFAGEALETAVAASGRMIRTGEAQAQGMSADDFRTSICSRVMALFDCNGGLTVDVRTSDTFANINMSTPLDADGNLDTNFLYDPGGGGEIVVIRAYYEWPLVVRLLGLDLANMSNGTHLLSAASAFRNEPFPW